MAKAGAMGQGLRVKPSKTFWCLGQRYSILNRLFTSVKAEKETPTHLTIQRELEKVRLKQDERTNWQSSSSKLRETLKREMSYLNQFP